MPEKCPLCGKEGKTLFITFLCSNYLCDNYDRKIKLELVKDMRIRRKKQLENKEKNKKNKSNSSYTHKPLKKIKWNIDDEFDIDDYFPYGIDDGENNE